MGKKTSGDFMRIQLAAMLVAVLMCGIRPAHADDMVVDTTSFHIGLASTGVGYEVNDSGEILSLNSAVLRGGYDFNRYFGVEVEAGLGTGDNDIMIDGVAYEAKIKNMYGAFAVAKWPVHRNIELFARAGYTQLALDGEYSVDYYTGFDMVTLSRSVSYDYAGPSGGIGIQGFFGANHGLRGDIGVLDLGSENIDGVAAVFSLSYAFRM
ncbi:MAG: hypothetical protein CME88_02920 [Hirschia sp.]|nr:hypothetical protein [Hirschia sp.]MBF17313.1 hypothetical protein [Hirschia sp.]|tara:strand:- start:129 stop:755 length:627 start_codon:yes stop_codon:yes gene_type:complete